MRIVTWNCRVGGFRQKASRVAVFRPDVLVVQEVENLDATTVFGGVEQPTFQHRTSAPQFPKRGTAVLSYTGTAIRHIDDDDAAFGFSRYEIQHAGVLFNLAAVWTWATKTNTDSYRQAHRGLIEHRAWAQQRPTVMLGDFNLTPSSGTKWADLQKLIDSAGLISAYHAKSREGFGAETRHTHFHLGRLDRTFHIDYCFVPREWKSRIVDVTVPEYAQWCDVSDHVPLIVDLAL
jgi:endonuclease/exonuclease/phosphatase family metal-dependent hydrolase